MSLQLNTTTIAGNLGAAPTIRTTAEGTKVCNFRLATNEYQGRDANGAPRFHTEWHQVVVEGALRTRSFEDKNGDARRVTEVKAMKIQFLDPRAIDDPWADADPVDITDVEA